MKKWIQKSFIIAVALLTFGVITPAHDIWNGLQEKSGPKQSAGPSTQIADYDDYYIGLTKLQDEKQLESLEDVFVTSARALSYEKFGTKIGPVIANEFDEVIFPKIDEAIRMTLSESDDLHKRRLAISERPAGNYSEKIFDVYDKDEKRDLIRFHVRTDKRPQDGYFFNFHYHIAEDGFTTHHTIGDIYWSKNTPPKWLS